MVVNGKSVTAAAFEVGYEIPNQFSREYARAFGLSPLLDTARIVGNIRDTRSDR
jgi:AraC-like DNA-binding protein